MGRRQLDRFVQQLIAAQRVTCAARDDIHDQLGTLVRDLRKQYPNESAAVAEQLEALRVEVVSDITRRRGRP